MFPIVCFHLGHLSSSVVETSTEKRSQRSPSRRWWPHSFAFARGISRKMPHIPDSATLPQLAARRHSPNRHVRATGQGNPLTAPLQPTDHCFDKHRGSFRLPIYMLIVFPAPAADVEAEWVHAFVAVIGYRDVRQALLKYFINKRMMAGQSPAIYCKSN